MDVFDKMASDFRKEAKIPRKSLKIQKGDKKTFKKWLKNLRENHKDSYLKWLAFEGARSRPGYIDPERVKYNLEKKLLPRDRKLTEKLLKQRPKGKKFVSKKRKASEEEFYYNLMLRMASEDEDFIDDLDDGFDRFASDMVGHGIFDEYDEDGDGMISRDEWGGSDSVFDAIDLDDDDMLSRDEVSTGIGEEFAEFNRYASEDDYDDLIDDLEGFDRFASEDDYDDLIDDLEGFDRYASEDDYDDDFEYRMARAIKPRYKKWLKKVEKAKERPDGSKSKGKKEPWLIVWKAFQGAYNKGGFNQERFNQNLENLGLTQEQFDALRKKTKNKGKKMKQQGKKEMMKAVKKHR